MCGVCLAGGWWCVAVVFLWVDGLLGHAACVRHHNHRVLRLVVGGVWLTRSVWGALVHCWVSGMAHGCCSWPGCRWLSRCVVVGCGVGVLCENWIVDASNLFFLYFVWFILVLSCMCCVWWGSVAFVVVCCRGARWMPGHITPMKDVEGRDSPRGVVNQALIRGCPNGVTLP